MQERFYFTQGGAETHGLDLAVCAMSALDDGAYSDRPELLDDGVLYRVIIEKVGIVRTTKEVLFDTAEQKESN
jgi:hypothetical protein